MAHQHQAERQRPRADGSSSLSPETIKMMAEAIGISTLPEDAQKFLAEEGTYRLKRVIQDSRKFMVRAKRTKLIAQDMDYALKAQNLTPLYGFTCADHIPFRYASGGGRELHFVEEKELDLDDAVAQPLPKIPMDVSLKAHWLAINGVQPAVPENPPPASRELQKLEGVDPAASRAAVDKLQRSRQPGAGGAATKKSAAAAASRRQTETRAKLKAIAEHELSVEQQLYYKEITEASVCSEEARRTAALHSLATDPGLHQMLPRLSLFISEGVKVNVVQNNLALLIYLMRMLKSLMDNSAMYLERYLHELIPAVCSCIVSKQLCMRPENDNHWALRDYAAKLIGQICKKFNTSTNGLQTRIVRILSEAMQRGRCPLNTSYGCVVALFEIGLEVVGSFVVPLVKTEGERIRSACEGTVVTPADRLSAEQYRTTLIRVLTQYVKSTRSAPDNLEQLKADFGPYIGHHVYQSILKTRLPVQASVVGSPVVPAALLTGTLRTGGSIIPPGQSRQIILPATVSRYPVSAAGSMSPLIRNTSSIVGATPINTGAGQPPQHKLFIVQAPPSAGAITAQQQQQSSVQQQSIVSSAESKNMQTLLKVVPQQQLQQHAAAAAAAPQQHAAAAAAPQQQHTAVVLQQQQHTVAALPPQTPPPSTPVPEPSEPPRSATPTAAALAAGSGAAAAPPGSH